MDRAYRGRQTVSKALGSRRWKRALSGHFEWHSLRMRRSVITVYEALHRSTYTGPVRKESSLRKLNYAPPMAWQTLASHRNHSRNPTRGHGGP